MDAMVAEIKYSHSAEGKAERARIKAEKDAKKEAKNKSTMHHNKVLLTF